MPSGAQLVQTVFGGHGIGVPTQLPAPLHWSLDVARLPSSQVVPTAAWVTVQSTPFGA